MCVSRTITLTFILLKLWPFFNLEFKVKVCVQAGVQAHIFHTTYTTAFKLGTVLQHHILSSRANNHNSYFHFAKSMALFSSTIRRICRAITVTCASASTLQLWLRFCMQGLFSLTTYAIAFKLQTLIGGHQVTLQVKTDNLLQNLTELCPFLD